MASFDFKSHCESLEQARTEAGVEPLRRQFDAYWDSLAPEALPQAREEFSSYLKEFNQEQMIRIGRYRKLSLSPLVCVTHADERKLAKPERIVAGSERTTV